MFRKTLTAAAAALTLAGATVTTSSSAQAGNLGKFVAAGIVGAVVGSALASRPSQAEYGYRPVRNFEGGYGGGFRPVRNFEGGYGYSYGGCGFRNSPIFDEYGNRIGSRRVPAC